MVIYRELNYLRGGNRASPIPPEFPYLNAKAVPPLLSLKLRD